MATKLTSGEVRADPRRLGMLRLSLTGGLASLSFFLLCWLGVLVGFPATHAYIALFTAADMASARALLEGGCWSLGFGLIAGALVAIFYNLFAPLERE